MLGNVMNSRYAAIAIIALTWGGPLLAQAQRVAIDAALHTSDRPYVQATGEATVSIKPDRAVIDIGVVTQGTTAVASAEQNAKQTDAVLADLRRMLGVSDQLRTTSYSVRPNYQYPKPGASPTITGYTATNVVEVTLDDLTRVGKVVDAATQSGANKIQGLQFTLKNSQSLRSQALKEAAEQAKASAEAIASGLGVKVLRVLSAEESVPGEDFGMKKKALPPPPAPGVPATPIEVGTIDVDAFVILRVEISQ